MAGVADYMADGMQDPVQRFKDDRQAAFTAGDPCAGLCTTANIDEDGHVQARTLVLRDIDDGLALFINASSPKWPHLQSACAVTTYWPTVQVQYRMLATTSEVDPELVAQSWQLRPRAPKQMDWFYQQISAQSSAITDRATLLENLSQLQLPDPLTAPEGARGLHLHLHQIERLDLNQENGIHARERYQLTNNTWQHQTLVP